MIFISGTGWVNGAVRFSEKNAGSGSAYFKIISSDIVNGVHEEIVLTVAYWCKKDDPILTSLKQGTLIQFHGRLTKYKRVPYIKANAPLQILQEPRIGVDVVTDLPETDLEATVPPDQPEVKEFE
jgi:hypothetical protein